MVTAEVREQTTQIQIPPLPLPGCVALGSLLRRDLPTNRNDKAHLRMVVRSKSSHIAGAKNGAWRPIGPGQVWVLSFLMATVSEQ